MDGEGVKQVSEMATARVVNVRLQDESIDAVVTPYSVIDLERFRDYRRNLRGKYCTFDIDGFSDYVKDHEVEDTHVFVDQKNFVASCFLDRGNEQRPGHCSHQAILTLDKTEEFEALEKFVGEGRSQQQLIDFMQDYKHLITPISDDNPIEFKAALLAIRHFKLDANTTAISSVANLSQTKSLAESIQAKSTQGVLPDCFIFETEPYLGLNPKQFLVRMSVRVGKPDTPIFSMNIARKEVLLHASSLEFSAILRLKLSGTQQHVKVVLGTLTP